MTSPHLRRVFSRAAALLALFVGLAACSVTPTPEIRAGAGPDDISRPPSGARYNYIMRISDVPVPMTLQLRSSRVSGNQMVYRGAMGFPLPAGADTAEIAELFQKALQRQGLQVRGNQLLVPTELRTDNAFRTTSSRFLRERTRYLPNDCWAVEGRCTYTQVEANGIRFGVISDTTFENGVWRSVQRVDPNSAPAAARGRSSTMVYSTDSNGVMVDLFVTFRGGPEGTSTLSIKRQ